MRYTLVFHRIVFPGAHEHRMTNSATFELQDVSPDATQAFKDQEATKIFKAFCVAELNIELRLSLYREDPLKAIAFEIVPPLGKKE